MPKDKPWWLPDPKFVISLAIIGLFAFAFCQDPTNQTMQGAILLAFATAYGFWLGSSKGAAENRDQLNKSADASSAALAEIAGGKSPAVAHPNPIPEIKP